MPNKKRIESDSLGTKKIDSKRLWGAQTQRSLENFKIANNKIPNESTVLSDLRSVALLKSKFYPNDWEKYDKVRKKKV